MSKLRFRIHDDLRASLEAIAHRTNQSKDWIDSQALQEYFRHDREWLRKEARRQSMLASKQTWEDADLWEAAVAEVWNDS